MRKGAEGIEHGSCVLEFAEGQGGGSTFAMCPQGIHAVFQVRCSMGLSCFRTGLFT